MLNHQTDPALPTAQAMPLRRQYHLLGWAALILLLILVMAAAIPWMMKPVPAGATPVPPGSFLPTSDQLAALKIMPVRAGNSAEEIEATGTISVDADHSTPVMMPYSGQVTQVLVEAGQHVVAGQALLKIKTPEFVDARNTLFSAAAQQANAASQLRIAQENARRQEEIYKSAGGALKDFRQAQNDLVTAQSAMRSADAALGAAKDRLAILGKTPAEISRLVHVGEVSGLHAETTLHAPASGIVASRTVAPGQYVATGGDKPVMTIADLTRVWLIAQLPESASSQVRLGDTVEVTTPAYPGRTFHAVIDNVAAGLDPVTHRLAVRATVANGDLALKPEMFASFTIRRPVAGGAGAAAIFVPASAVIYEGDVARVWVASSGGLLTARVIQVADSNAGWTRVASGLQPGNRVVTAGAIFVNEAGLGE